MLAIQLAPEIEAQLDALAKQSGRTVSQYAREIILEHLEDLEDIRIADQRLADIRSGKSKTVPLEVVMKRYGLKD